MDVGAVALEEPMRGDADEDEQIARRGAADTDLAFSGETDADAVLDPGRDVDGQRLLAPRPALAAACLAGIVDDPSGTLTARTGLLEREEPLLPPGRDRGRGRSGRSPVGPSPHRSPCTARRRPGAADRRLLAGKASSSEI
jgi:hypothetical protein